MALGDQTRLKIEGIHYWHVSELLYGMQSLLNVHQRQERKRRLYMKMSYIATLEAYVQRIRPSLMLRAWSPELSHASRVGDEGSFTSRL